MSIALSHVLPTIPDGLSVRPPSPAALSPAEIQQFRTEGFLVVPELCDADERQRLGATLRRLFEGQVGRAEGNQFDMLSLDREVDEAIQPQIVNPNLYAPELLHSPYYHRVHAIARQLLGADACFVFDHSILKPAGRHAATPWHQDEAHNRDLAFRSNQISFWMPLQDVTEANGCMRYVRASHHGPLLQHRSPNEDSRIHALEVPAEYVDESAAVALPVAAGWCILHDGRTLHSAGANGTASDRLVYVLVFRGPPVPRVQPSHFDWLERKRTANTERHRKWRRHGGTVVLLRRWFGRVLRSDWQGIASALHRIARQVRVRLGG